MGILRTVLGFRRPFAAAAALALSAPAFGQAPAGAGPADAVPADAPAAPPLEAEFLLTEPETPEELLRAAVIAVRLGRPNLARLYLQRFVDANPDDDTLLKLRDDLGPGAFARLANTPELRPLSTDLADRVTEAFRERGADPVRVNALIDDLGREARVAGPARQALVNAGVAVVPQIVNRLATGDDDYLAGRMIDVLVAIGEPVLPPLHAALEAENDRLRVELLGAIGRVASRRSVPHLLPLATGPETAVGVRQAARAALVEIMRLARVPAQDANPTDVARRLQDEAVRSLTEPAVPADAAEPFTAPGIVWTWEPAAATVRSSTVTPEGAALLRGTRFARQAFRLAPDRRDSQSLYLAFQLGWEAYVAGSPVPPVGPGTAFDLALAAGPDTVLDVLRQALRHDIPRAAVAALAVLGRTESPSILHSGETLILDALDDEDPRVQLAAAVAVLRLDPTEPFRHSRRVVEILARALSAPGVPAAVIIDQNEQRAASVAGFVRELGFDALVAPTGQTGFVTAAEGTQPAFVMVSFNVVRWPLSQTLANLRADSRTKSLPVVVYGPPPGGGLARVEIPDPRPAVERVLLNVPKSGYVVPTATSAAFATQMRPLLDTLLVRPLSAEELAEARSVAAYWLAQIADARRTDLYPLDVAEPALLSALPDPALTANVLVALGGIPTAAAQDAIAGLLLIDGRDPALLRAAAETLADHVRRHGLLIRDARIAELNRLWASTADPELRTALAAWGGTLRPDAGRVRERLEALPAVVVPAP